MGPLGIIDTSNFSTEYDKNLLRTHLLVEYFSDISRRPQYITRNSEDNLRKRLRRPNINYSCGEALIGWRIGTQKLREGQNILWRKYYVIGILF